MKHGVLWLRLTEDSRQKVLKFAPAKYPNLFVHHVTLLHKVDLSDQHQQLLGTVYFITLKENCFNNEIQAVSVELHGIASQNRFPHITISAKNGVHPARPNNMLETKHSLSPISGDVEVCDVLKFQEL